MSMQPDPRLEKVETIQIEWEIFTKVLKRNYLSPDYHKQRQDRSFVLRLYPPFEATMEAEYYESRQGDRYNNEWSEKPFHMKPELFVLEGIEDNFFNWIQYDDEQSIKNTLSESDIEDIGGIEAALQESHQIFFEELKAERPKQIDLGIFTTGPMGQTVDIEWIDD